MALARFAKPPFFSGFNPQAKHSGANKVWFRCWNPGAVENLHGLSPRSGKAGSFDRILGDSHKTEKHLKICNKESSLCALVRFVNKPQLLKRATVKSAPGWNSSISNRQIDLVNPVNSA
jgi:hypothetical protein